MHILTQTIPNIILQANIAIEYGDFKIFTDLIQDAAHSTVSVKPKMKAFKLDRLNYGK